MSEVKDMEIVEKAVQPIVQKVIELPPVSMLTPTERIERNKEMIAVLAPIIKRHHLSDIQGKQYMNVGGGIAVANALGYAVSVSEVTYDKDMKVYKASAELKDANTGVLVASAVGYVGDDEKRWAKGPISAKLSMTQTRAEAKLLRANFGSQYTMLGASSDTPAEEMRTVENASSHPVSNNAPSVKRNPRPPSTEDAKEIVVASVESKSGETNGKQWTVHLIGSEDGEMFSTFEESVKDLALSAMNDAESKPVYIKFEISEYQGTIRRRISEWDAIPF
tara:strand:+ start:1058 stop:1891 length:834 start_codon:yes stop_codon:yes gene_type:complete